MPGPSPLQAHSASPAELRERIEAERGGRPFLVLRDGDGAQRILHLEDDATRISVGRAPGNELSLHWDTEVSRLHAELEQIAGEWTISDDGLSRNGTFVNGSRVYGRKPLHDRDRLCCGETALVFRAPADPDNGASTARAPGKGSGVPLSETQRKILIALCRPVHESTSATPATNRQIADEVFLSVDAVKAHLRVLFDRFGAGELAQNEKRARLTAQVLMDRVVQPKEF